MKLRKYQSRTVSATLSALHDGANGVLIQAPCGSGKTEIAMELMRRLGKRWVLVVPNAVLATQSERRLRQLGLDVERYGVAGPGVTSKAPIQVATIQMLLERDATKRLRPDFICFDEAHHYEAASWSMFAARYPKANRIGLTATPERDDGRSLLRHFDVVIEAVTYRELIASRLLVPARLYTPTVTEPGGLAMDPIKAWNALSEGRRTIMAFGRVDEARAWAEKLDAEFGPRGYRAACVAGEDKRSFNDAVLRDFACGKIHILTNVYYIAEGFDLPDVGCIVYARRFQFRGTYVQFGGRGLRMANGKRDCIAIDLTGCSYKHGDPDGDYPWTLEEQNKPGRQKLGNGGGDGECAPRGPLDVSGEGLVRVRHGALEPSDPDPAPLCDEMVFTEHDARGRVKIDQKARKLAGRKGVAAARYWAEREKKRCGRLMAKRERSSAAVPAEGL